MQLPLILASSSIYRRKILNRLGIQYQHCSPDIDETRIPGESPEGLVMRLASEKAKHVAADYPNHLIIGCDQVAHIDDRIFGKPKDHDDAVRQLTYCSGKTLRLCSGIALYNSANESLTIDIDYYTVSYRTLSAHEIEAYLAHEKPYDCCGSLKAEGIGIFLLNSLSGDDPNTLIGFPIIKLNKMLQNQGVSLLQTLKQ